MKEAIDFDKIDFKSEINIWCMGVKVWCKEEEIEQLNQILIEKIKVLNKNN